MSKPRDGEIAMNVNVPALLRRRANAAAKMRGQALKAFVADALEAWTKDAELMTRLEQRP